MIRPLRLIGIAAAVLLAAAATPTAAEDGRVPVPDLAAAAQGDACVEPADVMRRNHMDLLKAQRDETMRLGIRGGKYSLTGCVDCHATADPESAKPQVRTIDGFCEECHAYAAVTLDCWSCHTPEAPGPAKAARRTAPLHIGDGNLMAALKAHLSQGSATP